MTTNPGNLIRVAVAGGIGGLVNAALCYLQWPIPIPGIHTDFKWHVIPAGAVHGAVLALVSFAAAGWSRRMPRSLRWGLSLPVGWVAGYLSWIPLDMSAFSDRPGRALLWPLMNGDSYTMALWTPAFLYFGGVAVLLYLWLCRPVSSPRAWPHILAASLAGIAGSLWWWITFETWPLSPLHGAIWGCLVGLAIREKAANA